MLNQLLETLSITKTKLIAVSKTRTVEQIMPLYEKGQRDFGENRVQELVPKFEAMPKDIRWHLIGHLQTNKVKQIAPFVHLIHSIDSFKLLKEVNKQAKNNNRSIDCLLQFKIAAEDTKYGFDLETAKIMLEDPSFSSMEYVNICGVMGMATFTDNQVQVRREFKTLKTIFHDLRADYFLPKDEFAEISMGMSGDYMIAAEEGSTMVRIGSLLFGPRVY